MFSQLAYVKDQLGAHSRDEWRACGRATKVPFSTIKRIAYGQTKNPGVIAVDKIAAYFRTRESRAKQQERRAA